MLKVKKINDEIVEPIKQKPIDPKNILGHSLIPILYSNIIIIA